MPPQRRYATARQFLLFTSVGAIGTVAHYLVLIALVHFFRVDPLIASTGGALLGALVNYQLNSRFTFPGRHRHRIALPRYALITAIGFAANTAGMSVTLAIGMNYLVAQLLTTGFVFLFNFLTNRFWVFGKTYSR